MNADDAEAQCVRELADASGTPEAHFDRLWALTLLDPAIRLRQRVVTRLAPRVVQRWAIRDAQPVLAWSSDSRVAAISESSPKGAFDIQVNKAADQHTLTVTATMPLNPMLVPNDGNLALRSLHSPDGNHVLVQSRDAVTLWSRPRLPVRWQGQGLQHAWFDSRGRLLLKTTTQALQVKSDGTMTILDDIELPTATATVAPLPSAALDLLAVGESDRLVRI